MNANMIHSELMNKSAFTECIISSSWENTNIEMKTQPDTGVTMVFLDRPLDFRTC